KVLGKVSQMTGFRIDSHNAQSLKDQVEQEAIAACNQLRPLLHTANVEMISKGGFANTLSSATDIIRTRLGETEQLFKKIEETGKRIQDMETELAVGKFGKSFETSAKNHTWFARVWLWAAGGFLLIAIFVALWWITPPVSFENPITLQEIVARIV